MISGITAIGKVNMGRFLTTKFTGLVSFLQLSFLKGTEYIPNKWLKINFVDFEESFICMQYIQSRLILLKLVVFLDTGKY